MSTLDLDNLRRWVGHEESRAELVTISLVERFRATFSIPGDTREGNAAPSMIHFCLAPPAAPGDGLGHDGHPSRGGFLPPVPLPRRMWAGGSLTFHGDIRVGEPVTRHSRIRDVCVKEGRTGTLCFVTIDHRIDSGGRHVIDERHDIVYRGVDAPGGPKAPEEAPKGKHCITVTPAATLLFRYSALTFNGHRIHYDSPYAREVEGYPGLVVHGPLQATLLAQFAEQLGGRSLAHFDFRSFSPIFDTADFTLNADEEDGGLRLWTASVGGPVAMEAHARW